MAEIIAANILTSHLLVRMCKGVGDSAAPEQSAQKGSRARDRRADRIELESKLEVLEINLAVIEPGIAKREIRSAIINN